MKNKINVLKVRVFGIIALVAIFIFSSANCFAQSINSPDALKQYLDNQPINSPNEPIKIAMGVNDLMIKNIATVIMSAGKYVSIEFTGNALTTIPAKAFEGNKTLVYIKIPNNVKSIGEDAFDGCTSLFNVNIPDSVVSIDKYAFKGCKSLFSVTIPNIKEIALNT